MNQITSPSESKQTHPESDCENCGIFHTSYTLQKENQIAEYTTLSKIVNCHLCKKAYDSSLIQKFYSGDKILDYFHTCIPCALRIKEKRDK